VRSSEAYLLAHVVSTWNGTDRERGDPLLLPTMTRQSGKTWDASQLAQFLDHARRDRLAGLWVLLAETGMRRSEALGLRWSDVDLDAARGSVSQTLTYVGTKAVFGDPKTARSRRLIAFAPETVTALRARL